MQKPITPEQKAFTECVLDDMVDDAPFIVVGVNEAGSKLYKLTEERARLAALDHGLNENERGDGQQE